LSAYGSAVVDRGRVLTAARVVGLLVLLAVITRWAWIGDDALITVRTALNLANGWGWGFNAAEAVEGYTHPLWFMSILAVGALTHEWVLGVFVLSLGFAAVAFGVLLWNLKTVDGVVRLVVCLGLSNCIIEYSTSGLENPLAFALIAGLYVGSGQILTIGRGTFGRLALIGVLSGLLIVTRTDLILLILPAGTLIAWHLRSDWRRLVAALGPAVLIVAGWLCISYLAYGTVVPNTLAAKTNVQIPRSELVFQGLRYVAVSVGHDPISGLVLVLGLVLAVLLGTRLARAWAVGILAYLAYWVWLGGDFMAGRALSVPTLVAAALVAYVPVETLARVETGGSRRAASRWALAFTLLAAGCVLVIGLEHSDAMAKNVATTQRWNVELTAGVADEYGVYANNRRRLVDYVRGLGSPAARGTTLPVSSGELDVAIERVNTATLDIDAIDALAKSWPQRLDGSSKKPWDVRTACGLLGGLGMASGPGVQWVDECGLTDAFLASVPVAFSDYGWRAGHLPRPIPEGYVEAVKEQDPTLVKDASLVPGLFDLWDRIHR
jgi:arabinofuranosyltransferase